MQNCSQAAAPDSKIQSKTADGGIDSFGDVQSGKQHADVDFGRVDFEFELRYFAAKIDR